MKRDKYNMRCIHTAHLINNFEVEFASQTLHTASSLHRLKIPHVTIVINTTVEQ